MPDLFAKAATVKNSLRDLALERIRQRRLAVYLRSDRRPWSAGYWEFRMQSLEQAIQDDVLLTKFRERQPLPEGYGLRLDARIIEIPWVLSRIPAGADRFLDAGSALNHEFVLNSSALAGQQITIVTLAPEGQAFWQLGVSYVFGDLRKLDFRDDLFDSVACISTIEHIGMDNSMYAGNADIALRGDPAEFLLAVQELKRVLKPGGRLFISFPFGRYENHGWFQQFDAELVDRLVSTFSPAEAIETIFKYEPTGWRLSDRASCAQCEFFDIHESKRADPQSATPHAADYAAGERALACLELRK
jgi:SAM-dependent methyltransferase